MLVSTQIEIWLMDNEDWSGYKGFFEADQFFCQIGL